MRIRNVIITASAGLALVLAGTAAGAAIASSPVSSGVVHACYTTRASHGSHAVVLQNAGTSCPAGTTAVTWIQQGRTGARGATGSTGPAGPSTAGPAGLDTIQVTSGIRYANTFVYGIAVCPADHPYVLGGGSHSTGEVQGSYSPMLASYPLPPNPNGQEAWYASDGFMPNGNPPSDFTIYAICAK